MKTPEEIKKGLECCNNMADGCMECPYETEGESGWHCVVERNIDALAYIQQLEHNWDELFEKAKQLERERDAAVNTLEENRRCETCKHYSPGYFCPGCRRGDKWEWRGV